MRALAALVAALVVLSAPSPVKADNEHDTLHFGDRSMEVAAVQLELQSMGYAVDVTGFYGQKTYKAIVHWQKANGLVPDGVVGPKTWSTFDLTDGASASAPATRVGNASPASGVGGLPFAPEGLSGCAEMEFYRVQWGLPEQFGDMPQAGPRSQMGYGWRESNCRNDVVSWTGCCVGYLQIHTGNFTAPGYRSGIAACEVSKRSDILGNAPLQKQKQMCVAKVLYDVSGLSPWRL